jgi:zinc transporter ZupT
LWIGRTIWTCVCFFSVYENYFVVYVCVLELVSERPTRGMLVKSPVYGDVSKKTVMGVFYLFSAGTLIFVRMIEMFVEIFCHRTRTIGGSRSFLFFLVRTIRTSCIIMSPNP